MPRECSREGSGKGSATVSLEISGGQCVRQRSYWALLPRQLAIASVLSVIHMTTPERRNSRARFSEPETLARCQLNRRWFGVVRSESTDSGSGGCGATTILRPVSTAESLAGITTLFIAREFIQPCQL